MPVDIDVSQFASAADPMLAYLTAPVESSSDAPSTPDLQPEGGEIHGDQSPAAPSRSASETPPAETVAPAPNTGEAPSTTPSPATPAGPTDGSSDDLQTKAANWDQLQAALREHQELQRQQQFEQHVTQQLGRLSELDDDDIPAAANAIIAEVQRDAASRMQPQIAALQQYSDRLKTNFMALVSALETEFDEETLNRVRTLAEEERKSATSAQDIQNRHMLRKQLTAKQNEQLAQVLKENEALRAQLAGQTVDDSGVFNVESAAVGAGTQEEPTSVLDLLLQGKL